MPIGQTITRVRPRVYRCPCDRHEDGEAPIGFCPDHAAALHAIREDFEREREDKSLVGTRRRSPGRPQCTTIGCFNDRVPPLPVCRDCAEEDGS